MASLKLSERRAPYRNVGHCILETKAGKMKLQVYVIGILISLIASHVGAEEIFQGPQAAIYIAPSVYNGKFSSIAGDQTIQYPTWYVAQWGIPFDLTASQNAPPGKDWSINNAYGRVKYLELIKAYELAQNGNTTDLACGTEYDLFLEPKTTFGYPNYLSKFKKSSPLSTIKKLIVNVGVNIVYESVKPRCSNPFANYSAYTVSFILENTSSNQTFFYQIILRDSRIENFPTGWCPLYENPGQPNIFCVSEDKSYISTNSTKLTPGSGRKFYSLDFKTRLAKIIQSGHKKANSPSESLDSNLANWKVRDMYFGQILEGGAISTSQWDAVRLEQF